MNFLRSSLAVFTLLFAFILPAQAGLARAYGGEVFVPNAGQESTYVHLELYVVDKNATLQAKKAMRDLRSQVMKSHHPEGKTDVMVVRAKCLISVHQVTPKDPPAYRSSCWSITDSHSGTFEKWFEAATPAAMLAAVREFAAGHFKRLEQPGPMREKERPQDRRTLIRTI